MGVSSSKRQHVNPNLVLDYHFSLFRPLNNPIITLKHGPSMNALDTDYQNEIQYTLTRLIRSGDEYDAEIFRKYKCCLCCYQCSMLPLILALPGIIVGGILTANVYNYQSKYMYFAIIGGIIMFSFICFILCCICCTSRKMNKACEDWRENIIGQIHGKSVEWQDQFGQFAFNVIYPIYVYGNKQRIRNVSGILRVTMGPIQKAEPIYNQGHRNDANIEMKLLNERRIHPQQIVHGQRAIIDGKEVIIIENPQLQQVVTHQSQLNMKHIDKRPVLEPLPAEAAETYRMNAVQHAQQPAYNPNVIPVIHNETEGHAM